MLYWLGKEERNRIKTVLDRLETLFERDRQCQASHQTHESSQNALDADMSALWDKVNHALARIGGRAKKPAQEPDEPSSNGGRTVEELNLAIVRGEVTSWP